MKRTVLIKMYEDDILVHTEEHDIEAENFESEEEMSEWFREDLRLHDCDFRIEAEWKKSLEEMESQIDNYISEKKNG